jgi:hypothetical protein
VRADGNQGKEKAPPILVGDANPEAEDNHSLDSIGA